jgi:ethanolamine utilization protein EutA
LISRNLINGDALRNIVVREYSLAGYEPKDIKAGAVIITGETARKENAEILLHSLSDYVGDFVVATAGSDLESAIAGKGAGTAELSKREKRMIANFDVGGGTTNVAIFKDGELIDTTCLDIGGRLIRIDPDTMMVEYVAPKIADITQHMGIDVREGYKTDVMSLRKIARRMAAFLDEISGLFQEQRITLYHYVQRIKKTTIRSTV